MTAAWSLVGRARELREITTAISSPGRGGVVLAGPAGVGKTRLARDVVATLDPRRFCSVQAVASSATRSIPFGALAHLLPSEPVAPGPLNRLGWALAAILGATSNDRRLVVSVDDAHLLDETSAAIILQLARTSDAFVLVTVRDGEPGPDAVRLLWKDGPLPRVELSPLSIAESTEMIGEVLGGEVDARTAHWLWRVTEGNPLYLREMMLAGVAAGTLAESHGVFRWSGGVAMAPRLAELIGSRLGELDEAQTSVLEFVAFAEPIEVNMLAKLTSPAAVDDVQSRKLIVVEQGRQRTRARLAHPLYGEALRARCPELRAGRRIRDLADALEATGSRRRDDALRLAVWRLDTGTAHDAEQMMAACRIAWSANDMPLASRLGWAAVNAGAGADAAATLAMILNYRERFDDAEAALAKVKDAAISDLERAQLAAARTYSVGFGQGRLDAAVRLLDNVRETVTESVPERMIAAMRAELLISAGRGADEVPVLETALADQQLPAPMQVQSLVMAGFGHGHAGRRTDALERLDRAMHLIDRCRDTVPYEEARGHFMGALTDVFAGELNAAEAHVADLHAEASREWHWDFALAVLSASLGQISRLRGRFSDAESRCREAVATFRTDVRMFGPFFFGELAHAQALMGDVDGSRESLAESERRRTPAFGLFNYWIDIARPWVVACGGDVATAVDHALDTADRAHDAGLVAFEVVAAHDAVRLGAAGRATERLQAAAALAEGAYPAVCADHATAVVSRDGDALLGVADRFAELGMLLHAAEAAAQSATTFHADGEVSRSRAAAARAWALARRCDSASTPALAALRAPGLTRTEREIAHLAAAGWTSRDIAARCGKAVRTVDNQLRSVYQKLGVDDRNDLAGLLADTNPPAR